MDELDKILETQSVDQALEKVLSPTPKGTGSEVMDYYLAQRFAMLNPDNKRYIDAVNVTLDMLKTMDEEEVRNSILATIETNKARLMEQRLDILAADQQIGQPVTTLDEAANEVIKPPEAKSEYEQLVDTILEQLSALPDGFRKEIARQDAMWALARMRMEQLGINPDPTIWNTLGTLVPGRNLEDLGFGIKYSETVKKFRTLAQDEQFRQWINIIDELAKETSNPSFMLERLAPYINESDINEVKFAIANDAFDVTLSLPIIKILRLLKFGQTPAKLLRDAGKEISAAEIVANAMKSEKAAKAASTTIDDAVASSSPFASEGIDPRLTEGVSAEVQRIIAEDLAKQEKLLRPLHDDTIMQRRVWDEEEVQAALKRQLNTFAGKARHIREEADGHLWEVDVVKTESVLSSLPKIRAQIERLQQQLVGLTDIELKDALAQGLDKEAIKDIKTRIIRMKREIANLRAIEQLDFERNDILVRLNQAKKSVQDPLDDGVKELTKKLVENKAERARLVDRLQTKTIETKTTEQFYVKFTEDDFGNLTATQLDLNTSRFINSPSTIISQMKKGLVSTARNIGFTQEQMRTLFQDSYAGALKKLNYFQRKKLDRILLQGDHDEVVYSAADLINGIRTPDGILKMDTAEELSAYFQIRRISDDLFVLKNRELVRRLELGGYKAFSADGKMAFANPSKPLQNAPEGVTRAWDMMLGDIGDVRPLLADEAVFRLRKPIIKNGEEINYVIAKQNDFKEIPARVLDYRRGYIPKIRENIFYVAEARVASKVDGANKDSWQVIRFFDNPKDVETWQKANQNSKEVIRVQSTNQWFSENPTTLDNWEEMMFGGTYEGSRTDGKIPFNLTGTEAERMGALEALEAYMNHLSTRVPSTDFRRALVKRFENSAKDPITGQSYLNKSGDWRDPLNIDKTNPNYAGLKAMQDWVKAQLAVPTTEERLWNNFALGVARLFAKSPIKGDRLSAIPVKLTEKDIVGAMKTTAFHVTLGFLNPAQLYVQAMGAATAFALDPIGAPINIAKYLALRAALLVEGKASPKAIIEAAKAAGENPKELALMVEAYRRTGIHQSIRSSGDYGLNTGMYASPASIRYLADKGLVFFREGERFVRGYAWIQAWRKLYKPGIEITDEFIDKVTNESIRYTLDLNRANKAYWQSGVLSVPTQFMQITTKFVENLFYKGSKLEAGWTREEKFRIAAANMLLFGAAGVPGGNWIISNAIAYLKDDSDFGLGITDPQILTALSGGLVEATLYGVTGEAPAISERVSIPYGIEQFVDRLTEEDSTFWEIAAGVFGEVPKRSYQALAKLINIYSAVGREPSSFDMRVVAETITEIGEITSSWRNIRKAVLWERANALLTTKGEKIDQLEGARKWTIVISQALGVSPKEISQYYDLVKYNKESEQTIRESVDAWFKIAARYAGSPILNTPTGQKRVENQIEVILSDLTQAQRKEVSRRIARKLADKDYKITKELLKFMENALAREGDLGNLETNSLLLPEGKRNAE
jgi:hypothetical protein